MKRCLAGQELLALTNSGSNQYDHEGDFIFLPMKVYVKKYSLAIVLSMKEVCDLEGVTVTMDSSIELAIIVCVGSDKLIKFKQCANGLYFCDTALPSDHMVEANHNKENISSYSLLTNVSHNKKFFTKREIEAANRARDLQGLIGWPSTASYKT